MKTTVALACLILLLGFGKPAVALDLPPDVRADQYLLEATEALEQGDPQTAIRAFEKIEVLDTEPPVEFLFFYGKLLVENSTAVDGVRKGQVLLKQFILNVGKTSEHYRPTLKLLSVAERKIEAAERRRIEEAKREAAEAKRRAEEAKQQAEAKRQRLLRLKELLLEIKQQMVTVQGGTFTMGCTEEQSSCDDDEMPAHQVQVKSFSISKYEVTQDLWEAVMGENPSHFKGCAQCPVEQVSWDDIQVFLEKLNIRGDLYRLPTEAEWEYAARGGQRSRGYEYAGSNAPGSVAWYDQNGERRTHPVGEKQSNELGLYDMSGNVWEWVQDCLNENYEGAPSDGSAWTSGDCSNHVVRGGSWGRGPRDLRSVDRVRSGTGYRNKYVGFRLARTLTP